MPILDATKYGVESNSYLEVYEADEIMDNLYGAEDWVTLSEDDKMRLLISATEAIDHITISETKAVSDQALNFPLIEDNVEVGYNEAKRCCALQAFYLYENNDSIKSAVEESIQNIKTQNFGKVQTTKSSSGLNFFKRYDPKVIKILAPFLSGDSTIHRG
jgi:hypothetical protein